ncbi:hypothetical protein [Microseira sp. BLCC-F43]|uniref:hypothetical protein n=1 Tax=Microseira sp. BLCC-F43 TaxID=3153602 RepID=UPI0035BABF16
MVLAKGGRGKKAPYKTEMYRIPSPIKETVQQLAAAFKRVCGNESSLITPSQLLKQVQSTIARAAYPQRDLEAPKNLISTSEATITESCQEAMERLEAVRELMIKWKGNAKDTRNWVEANRLLRELEKISSPTEKYFRVAKLLDHS